MSAGNPVNLMKSDNGSQLEGGDEEHHTTPPIPFRVGPVENKGRAEEDGEVVSKLLHKALNRVGPPPTHLLIYMVTGPRKSGTSRETQTVERLDTEPLPYIPRRRRENKAQRHRKRGHKIARFNDDLAGQVHDNYQAPRTKNYSRRDKDKTADDGSKEGRRDPSCGVK